MSTLLPKEIKRLSSGPKGTGMTVSWNSGAESSFESEFLREKCPCASCSENRAKAASSASSPRYTGRGALKVVDSSLEEETNLSMVFPIGNYALGMRWADGHDSGIYSFNFLWQLHCLQQQQQQERP